MKLGIKVGPTDWEEKLSKAKFCAVEVHFRPENYPQYLPLFEHLKKCKVSTGLHFWGILKNGCFPNFASEDSKVLDESIMLFKNTIKIARQWKFDYVLTHPFSCDWWKLDENQNFKIKPLSISWREGFTIMQDTFRKINRYAKSKDINFVIETGVKHEPLYWGENHDSESIIGRTPSVDEFSTIGKHNIKLALDFAHMTTWIDKGTKEEMLQQLQKSLLNLKKYTFVLHLGSIKAPFNTDTGNGFTPKEEADGVFPNSKETLELLTIFQATNCIVIPEPQKQDHLWHNEFLNKSGLFN